MRVVRADPVALLSLSPILESNSSSASDGGHCTRVAFITVRRALFLNCRSRLPIRMLGHFKGDTFYSNDSFTPLETAIQVLWTWGKAEWVKTRSDQWRKDKDLVYIWEMRVNLILGSSAHTLCFPLKTIGGGVTSWTCDVCLCRGHANLLCIVPILVYALPKQYIMNMWRTQKVFCTVREGR